MTASQADGNLKYILDFQSALRQFTQKYEKIEKIGQSKSQMQLQLKLTNGNNNNNNNNVNNKDKKAKNKKEKILPKLFNGYEGVYHKYPDLITGFYCMTPSEQIIVLETRAKEPMETEYFIQNIIQSYPGTFHILCDSNYSFPAPREYCLLDSLIQKIKIPISMNDLVRLSGLYFQNTKAHELFPIIQKLEYLMQCKSIQQADNENLFPTVRELRMLAFRTHSLFSAPLQPGIPIPPQRRNPGANFGFTFEYNNNYNNKQKSKTLLESKPLSDSDSDNDFPPPDLDLSNHINDSYIDSKKKKKQNGATEVKRKNPRNSRISFAQESSIATNINTNTNANTDTDTNSNININQSGKSNSCYVIGGTTGLYLKIPKAYINSNNTIFGNAPLSAIIGCVIY